MAEHQQYNRYSGGSRDTRKSRVTCVLHNLIFQPLYETVTTPVSTEATVEQRKTQRGRSPPLQEQTSSRKFCLTCRREVVVFCLFVFCFVFFGGVPDWLYIKFGKLIFWMSISSMGLTKQEYRVTAVRPPSSRCCSSDVSTHLSCRTPQRLQCTTGERSYNAIGGVGFCFCLFVCLFFVVGVCRCCFYCCCCFSSTKLFFLSILFLFLL